MFINPHIIEMAKETIDKGEKSFVINGTLVFYVSKKDEYDYEVGSMPSYFNYEKDGVEERYVVYKKPNMSREDKK